MPPVRSRYNDLPTLRSVGIRTVFLVITFVALGAPSPCVQGAPRSIFSVHQADRARQLARDECKPLILHFVPDNAQGGDQLVSFYTGPDRVADGLLDQVVIVALPRRTYGGLARKLGIADDGGYRTISPYDLGVFDRPAVTTIRSGFI